MKARLKFLAVSSLCFFSLPVSAQQGTTATQAPNEDTSYIAPDGTAHVTRVVPVPQSLSLQAQRFLAGPASDAVSTQTLEQRRIGTDAWQTRAGEASRKVYPASVRRSTIAGVPVRLVTPLSGMVPDRVLINLHGGGFNSDSGSLTETIPIVNLTKMKVVAVLYRLAPEHPFPAALDDAIAVYKDLLRSYKPGHIAIYGTSAGAVLTGEVAVQIKRLGLPEPGALGMFSGFGDFSRPGDSEALFELSGLSGHLEPPKADQDHEYTTSTDLRDPVLSPVFANLQGMPPALFISSERDLLLSGTTILERAYLRAGDEANLIVFEGLPHAFWNDVSLPESREAYRYMARFFTTHLQ
jgi:epsilon-lactone hydrolase